MPSKRARSPQAPMPDRMAGGPPKPQTVPTPEAAAALSAAVRSLSIGIAEPVGREPLVSAVEEFLADEGDDQCPHFMLQLFGMPGTGKTAVVRYALSRMVPAQVPEEEEDDDAAPVLGSEHTALFLNGYLLQKPAELYSRLYQHLSEQRLGRRENLTPELAAQALEKRFTMGWGRKWATVKAASTKYTSHTAAAAPKREAKPKVPLAIIVVDEMDRCCEKTGKVLFRLLDWLTLPNARCRLITIANAMYLPETMEAKERSRMNTTRKLTLEPYTTDQLKAILEHRLKGIKPTVISKRASDYVCQMVAGQSGDVRRLLQACAGAVHSVLDNASDSRSDTFTLDPSGALVGMRHIAEVWSNSMYDPLAGFIPNLQSPWMLLVIAIICAESERRELAGQPPEVPEAVARHKAFEAAHQHGAAAKLSSGMITRHDWNRTLTTFMEAGLLVKQLSGTASIENEGDTGFMALAPKEEVYALSQGYETVATQLQTHSLHQAFLKRVMKKEQR